jgi:hypothetical protein
MLKLQLRRETVRSLQESSLLNVVGGSTSDSVDSCDTTWGSACAGSVLNSCDHQPTRIGTEPTEWSVCIC